MHNFEEKLLNSDEPDLSWQEAVDLSPEDEVEGSSEIYYFTDEDGTQIHYKDWGNGQPIMFSHGWPLSAEARDAQMLFLAQNGYRVIAHDRRGHGRSEQTWDGNTMDQYADDLST